MEEAVLLNRSFLTLVRSRPLICLFVILTFAASCSSGSDPALSRGSTVTIAHPGLNGRGFNPELVFSERDLVFLPLMRINESGQLEGALAESWDYAPESREVTYHLRRDARWHDGVPVTAHDVKFSMELMTHPEVLLESPALFETIEVLDDFTLRVRGHRGGYDEVSWPRHLLEGLDPANFYEWEFWYHPVGNGPYRFSRYEPRQFLELEANPDYFAGKPRIERLVLRFVGDAGIRELIAGKVDAVTNVQSPEALLLQNDPRFKAYYSYNAWWVQEVIWWQHGNRLFRDPEVRRALTLAIDRPQLQRLLQLPTGIPIVDAPYFLEQLASNELPKPIPYDLERSRILLEQAGWIDTDGDGIREKGGREFRFSTVVSQSHSNNKLMAVYIQEQLRSVGVEMDILLGEVGVVYDKIINGEFEAALGSFTFNLDRLFRATGYQDAELRRIQQRVYGWWYLDPNEKAEGYRRAHEIFLRDVPVTFLGPRIRVSLVHKRIQGLITPWRADPIWHLEHLWINEDPGP